MSELDEGRPVRVWVKSCVCWLGLVLLGTALTASAQEFTNTRTWIHVDGYSYHFAAPGANDKLWGIGFTQYRRTYGRLVSAWEGDVFADSAKKPSAYLGASWTIPTRFLSFGATGAVMYHRNFATQNRLRLLPVAFPYLETRGTRLKARLYYVIPMRRASDEQIAVQLMLPWFREGAARRPARPGEHW